MNSADDTWLVSDTSRFGIKQRVKGILDRLEFLESATLAARAELSEAQNICQHPGRYRTGIMREFCEYCPDCEWMEVKK